MKDISILALLACVILCGCRSDSTLAPGYVSPTQLVGQIQSADHIIVKHLIPGQPDFSTTITGPEVKRIIYAIASARAPACSGPSAPSSMLYDWQLQFYRRGQSLGTAELGCNMFRCSEGEYPSPWTLRRFYHHITCVNGGER